MRSIASSEEDWYPSQSQQEALLAEVALVINEFILLGNDEAVVSVDIASVSSSGSQSRFLFDLVLVLPVPTVPTALIFSSRTANRMHHKDSELNRTKNLLMNWNC